MLVEKKTKTEKDMRDHIQRQFDSQDEGSFRSKISEIRRLTEQFFEEAKKDYSQDDSIGKENRKNNMGRFFQKIEKELSEFYFMCTCFRAQKVGEDFDESGVTVYDDAGEFLRRIYWQGLISAVECCRNFYKDDSVPDPDFYKTKADSYFESINSLMGMKGTDFKNREMPRVIPNNENGINLNAALRRIGSGLSMLGGFLFEVVKSSIEFFSSLRENLSKRGEEEARLFVPPQEQKPTTSKPKSDPNDDHTKDEERAGTSLPQQKAEEDKPSISYLGMSGSF